MRKTLLALLSVVSFSAHAWEQSVALGYGVSHDPNHAKYTNRGAFLNGDFLPLYRGPSTLITLNGALGIWNTNAPEDKSLKTAALSAALRYYPGFETPYPAYLLASFGPAYLSSKRFGENDQGSNFAFQTTGGLGMEFDDVDLNLRFVHYSNCYTSNPNEGYNILFVLSLGYLFG